MSTETEKRRVRIKRRTLSLEDLAVLMGYTHGEKIVAIDYQTDAGGLIVIAEQSAEQLEANDLVLEKGASA